MSELTWDDYYWFVINRHRAWERRADGEPRPWSEDPIIDQGKFTNVFRALDPGSQYAMELLNYLIKYQGWTENFGGHEELDDFALRLAAQLTRVSIPTTGWTAKFRSLEEDLRARFELLCNTTGVDGSESDAEIRNDAIARMLELATMYAVMQWVASEDRRVSQERAATWL